MKGQSGFLAVAGGGDLQSEMVCAGRVHQGVGCSRRISVLCSLALAVQPLRKSGQEEWKEVRSWKGMMMPLEEARELCVSSFPPFEPRTADYVVHSLKFLFFNTPTVNLSNDL